MTNPEVSESPKLGFKEHHCRLLIHFNNQKWIIKPLLKINQSVEDQSNGLVEDQSVCTWRQSHTLIHLIRMNTQLRIEVFHPLP